MGVSFPRAFGRLEEAKGVRREETNMEDVNSRENQCQRALLSSEAGVWDRSWENTDKGCVEERYEFSILTQVSLHSSHILDRIPHSEEFFG